MRAVVQRVMRATVEVEGEIVGRIGPGLLVLVGVTGNDTMVDAEVLASKLGALRIFSDENGKMNLSVADVAGEVMVVSQFTLYGSTRKGRRPSFTAAAGPEQAAPLVAEVVHRLAEAGITVATGSFGAKMDVALVNDGPVTLVIDVIDGSVV